MQSSKLESGFSDEAEQERIVFFAWSCLELATLSILKFI